jgi:hypothetical protein
MAQENTLPITMIILEYQLAVKKIWKNAAKQFNIKKSRDRHNVIYRHAFTVACLDNTTLSMKVIGSIIGRHHATVIHARSNHSWNVIRDKAYAQAYLFFSDMLSKQTDEYEDVIRDYIRTAEPEINQKGMIQRYTSIYEGKIERLETKYSEELKTLRHENKTLSKELKNFQERTDNLNKECIRLKNLL